MMPESQASYCVFFFFFCIVKYKLEEKLHFNPCTSIIFVIIYLNLKTLNLVYSYFNFFSILPLPPLGFIVKF
jgi:hypothetical protein